MCQQSAALVAPIDNRSQSSIDLDVIGCNAPPFATAARASYEALATAQASPHDAANPPRAFCREGAYHRSTEYCQKCSPRIWCKCYSALAVRLLTLANEFPIRTTFEALQIFRSTPSAPSEYAKRAIGILCSQQMLRISTPLLHNRKS